MFLKVQAAGFLFYKILVLKDILLSSTGQFAQKRDILSQNGLFRNFISKQENRHVCDEMNEGAI